MLEYNLNIFINIKPFFYKLSANLYKLTYAESRN